MWLFVAGAEFTIDRPETTEGWIALAFVVVAVLWILAKGTQKLLNLTLGRLLYPAFGLVAVLGALVVFNLIYSDDNNDPLTRGEIEVLPNRTPAGSKVEVHPEIKGHVYDDHGGYDNYGGYEE